MWEFFNLPSAGVGLGAIVSFSIIAILSGVLVPVRSHNREIRLVQSQVTLLAGERDDWRDAYLAKSDEAGELMRQVTALIDSNKTTTALIASLREVAARQAGEK